MEKFIVSDEYKRQSSALEKPVAYFEDSIYEAISQDYGNEFDKDFEIKSQKQRQNQLGESKIDIDVNFDDQNLH